LKPRRHRIQCFRHFKHTLRHEVLTQQYLPHPGSTTGDMVLFVVSMSSLLPARFEIDKKHQPSKPFLQTAIYPAEQSAPSSLDFPEATNMITLT